MKAVSRGTSQFSEEHLQNAIIDTFGEHSAHADKFATIIKRRNGLEVAMLAMKSQLAEIRDKDNTRRD